MKIDRLIAITMYLLNRETVSASVLAERFEVSKRTIQRDIETLCLAGIPIVSSYGSDGGYKIVDGFRLTKQMAGLDDYLNIIIALKGLCSAYDNKKINETLEKVLTINQGSEQHLFVDLTIAREKAQVNEHLQVIEKAIHDKTPLLLKYTNADNITSERVVEPLALSFQWYAWYMFAYCTLNKSYRWFKLIRIIVCQPTSGFFTKVHGNIDSLMKNNLEPDKRKYYCVRLLCKKEVRLQVMEYLSTNITEEYDDGSFIVELNVPFERIWFSIILGFGNQVEVIDPPELITMLKQKADEIISVYK
jgi:predicted DNA-binding transcriptional regulator YafY